MTDRTQAAAQRCADLANAEAQENGRDERYTPGVFTTSHPATLSIVLRREVEAKQAMIREVLEEATELLSITAHPTQVKRLNAIIAKLRDNLLPDPQPTLLEEYVKDTGNALMPSQYNMGIRDALDWIAKREKEG